MPDGQQRYLGISISPLRSRDDHRSGYVFNFQDLTDFRRLENEVATKERMAALGRLSAAIAHENRQPPPAMGGVGGAVAGVPPGFWSAAARVGGSCEGAGAPGAAGGGPVPARGHRQPRM